MGYDKTSKNQIMQLENPQLLPNETVNNKSNLSYEWLTAVSCFCTFTFIISILTTNHGSVELYEILIKVRTPFLLRFPIQKQ